MDTVWLTYDELAEHLGIARESARTLVKRKHWGRKMGNDGKVRIGVPEELLSAKSEPGTEGATTPGQEPAQPLGHPPAHDPGVTAVLTRHIERLEAQLEEALERAGEHDVVAKERDLLAAQIEALRDSTTMQVDALKAALSAAERDRDRWHDVATLKPEPVAPVERRSWWRRLAG
jgi:hypothetical protein